MDTAQICTAIKSFCDELAVRAPEEIEPLLIGHKDRIRGRDLDQSPERFVSENLVWPVLRAVDVDFITEAILHGCNGRADFLIRNTSEQVLGECKPLNHYEKAVKDLREYLSHRTTEAEYGIATDGINWVFFREPDDRRRRVQMLEYHSFRHAMFNYWMNKGTVSPNLEGHYIHWKSSVCRKYGEPNSLRSIEVQQSAQIFASKFRPQNLDKQLQPGSFDRTLDDFQGEQSKTQRENWGLSDFF
ncbi:hypothetical protein C474_13649 [Halogeometricum pallidum JCM 14848]|uniref:Uncharacterized protein n=1 Tax=Halogeometricum pallidum JCM 14848 TaxID=1227487 RepID=M0D0G9_HALPD|nr:hypothetical protein [Halogeometricum pallidum]ELZ28950.1 hypothetical protein C474_13649 [Halogeometricum pallidum JCM 14848]